MRPRRLRPRPALATAVLGALALAAAVTAPANPSPLPVTDSLISEGITVEGPLINNVVLPRLA
ncbi:hypothetical protein [Streptomyces sp. NPDC052114]|uniref:hypothetical protein n=1 Tax=unclassified Streptomyces TaxID=2593676 RepID=UPI003432F0F9